MPCPNEHHRRSIRLPGYNYAQAGVYFVTMVTRWRECIFGDVVDVEMRLNEGGRIAADEWSRTSVVRNNVMLDAFVVMPNHLHGVIIVTHVGTAPPCTYEPAFGKSIPQSIPTIIGQFKSITTKRINNMRGTPGTPVWQRNYFEHIIRDEESLERIRDYILNNPATWTEDRENTASTEGTAPPCPSHMNRTGQV